jgi:hypothetical protein
MLRKAVMLLQIPIQKYVHIAVDSFKGLSSVIGCNCNILMYIIRKYFCKKCVFDEISVTVCGRSPPLHPYHHHQQGVRLRDEGHHAGRTEPYVWTPGV